MPTPFPTGNLANLSPPPRSLIHQVLSAVPPNALLDLMIPSKRQQLASQVQAGSTPTWYQGLPTDVKRYMGQVKSEVAGGALTRPTSSSSTASGSATDAVSGSASGTGSGTSASTTDSAGSSSKRGPGLQMALAVIAVVYGLGC